MLHNKGLLVAALALLLIAAACGPVATQSAVPAAEPTAPPAAAPTEVPAPTPVEPVVILVLDNFSDPCEPQEKIKANLVNAGTDNRDCLFTPDGQVYASRGLATNCQPGGVSHGSYVYSQILSLLKAANGKPLESQAPFGGFSVPTPYLDLWRTAEGDVLLIAVDVPGFDAGLAANNRAAVMNQLVGLKLEKYAVTNVQGVVVNMSFALVPCQQLNVDQYIADLVSYYSGEGKVDLRKTLGNIYLQGETDPKLVTEKGVAWAMDWAAGDPLYQTLNKDGVVTINIAAAGNSGFPYPFAPALWPGVLSVSASTGDPGTPKADYSNAGEVMVSGVHPDDAAVLGTSFAAPKLAFWAARYLLKKGGCDTTPPLAHKTITPSPGGWDDLSLATAIERHCSNPNLPSELKNLLP